MKEEVQEPKLLTSPQKKKILAVNENITAFKKNYAFKTLLSTLPLVLLAASNIYSLYKTKEIPLIDIISLGIHKASAYNQTLEKLVKKISFNNVIYWKNSSELFFTAPNILFLSTLGTAYALPQVAKRVFIVSKLNSSEANEIIKSTDPLVDYIELFKHIPVITTDITEFCLSIKETNHNINLSEEQKEMFAKEINNYYKLEALLYDLDFFTDPKKLEELIDALETLKINHDNLFFEKNETHDTQIEEIKTKANQLKEKLTDEHIKKIDLLEKLKIKQQQLKHILMKEEEEEEIALDINEEEEIKKILKIDYTNLETDLKKTNYLIKKYSQELKEMYDLQTTLFQEIPNLKNPHRELFEEAWNVISQSQQQKIIKEIGMNETSEQLSSYALSKLSPGTKIDIESLYLEKNTGGFIKKNYKNDFKSRILYFIKSSLPGHKITKEIEKKIEQFQKQKIKTGMEYDIEIISKLPTAELKDMYREKQFRNHTIADYKTYKINDLDMVTLSILIKSKIFQNFVIENMALFETETILDLQIHSPFLLDLISFYHFYYDKINNYDDRTKKIITSLEIFLNKIIKTTEEKNYQSDIILFALSKYITLHPEQKTDTIEKIINKKKLFWDLCEFYEKDESIKKYFSIPSRAKSRIPQQ